MTAFDEKDSAGGVAPPASVDRPAAQATVQVWDPVVRLFHWSLVVAFVVAWASGEELQRLHETAGYAIVGLLAIRFVWGFVGGRYARFSEFVYHPMTIIGHLAGTARFRARRYIGHNPAGGAMIIAMLIMLVATCVTGYMATMDAYWGVRWVLVGHKLAANLTVVLIGLHLVGVFAASVEYRENLVVSMITGRKRRE